MGSTPILSLNVYDPGDNPLVRTWRDELSANSPISSLVKIDTWAGEIITRLDALEFGTFYVLASRKIIAGDGLTGGGDLSTDRTISIDYATSHTWNGVHIFNESVYLNGTLAIGSDQLMINNNGTNVDVELQLYREIGGAFSIFWNGVTAWTTKAFRPFDLLINRISDTEPETTYSGMVWVHPHAELG